jgi:hypothetical protein
VHHHAVITDTAQFKKPVEFFSDVLRNMTRFNENFMDRSNHRAVFCEFMSRFQKGGACGVKCRIIGAGSGKVIVTVGEQLFCGGNGLVRALLV